MGSDRRFSRAHGRDYGRAYGRDAGERGMVGGAASPYTPEAEAYFAALSVQPDDTRKGVVDTLVRALQTADAWSGFDGILLTSAHHEQASRVNLASPALVGSYYGGTTFLEDRYFKGDGTTGGLNTGWDYSVGGPHAMAQDNFHMGLWVRTDIGGWSSFDMGVLNTGQGGMSIRARSAGLSTGVFRAQQGSGSVLTLPAATAVGHTMLSRRNAANFDLFKDGALVINTAVASVSPPAAGPMIVGGVASAGVPGAYSPHEICLAHWGGGFTDVQAAAVTAAFQAYLTAVGA